MDFIILVWIFLLTVIIISNLNQLSIEPFWMGGGTRRNMSHDIRGDVPIPFRPYVSPWNIPSVLPIRNRRMTIGEI